jgi:SAM-dependent methyltransferase
MSASGSGERAFADIAGHRGNNARRASSTSRQMTIRCLPGLCSVLVACAHAAAPPAAAPVDDATIQQRTHAVLDAYDRGDHAALDRALAPSFVKFENQHRTERAKLLENPAGKPPHPPIMTRSWKEQHVYRRDGDALFIGLAVEHETGNDSHGNRRYDGWYTMHWVRDRADWKVAHWSWSPHRTSIENARDMWNDNYRQGVGFDQRPNRLLVDTVRGVAPGAALDVMMGQGRNAVYLATQGWRVTGVDIADEGLRIAREAAAAKNVEITTIQADADQHDYGVARWDLVTMIYAGSSPALIEKLKPSIKPRGLFVLEFFHTVPGERGGFTADQLAGLFTADFDVLRNDVVDDRPDWAKDHARLVRFVARKR